MEKGRGDDHGKDEKQRGKTKISSSENHMVVYPQQPPPHHNCPRCNSSHTKFCYYNNYSLTQPRYFCKTCRRYWTHGGSLRNVPVGGGSRRGRRDKGLSPSYGEGSSSSRSTPPPQPLSMKLSSMVSLLSNSIGVLPSNHQPMRSGGASSAMAPMSPFYNSSGGFTSSLAAMQNLNLTPPPQGINRPLRIGGGQMCSSGYGNMCVSQEFNRSSNMRPQQSPLPQNQQPNNFDNINDRGKEPMYPYDQSFYQATRPMVGSNWNQSFSSNSNHHMGASSSTLWNGSDNNTANTSNANIPSSPVDPNEWPDGLPDFDPPDI